MPHAGPVVSLLSPLFGSSISLPALSPAPSFLQPCSIHLFFSLPLSPPRVLFCVSVHLVLLPVSCSGPGNEMTNLAFELDPIELEEDQAEPGEQGGSAKTSVSSVTTPPPHGKLIPFFKKVIPAGSSWLRWVQMWPEVSCWLREGGDGGASCPRKGPCPGMRVMVRQPDLCPHYRWCWRVPAVSLPCPLRLCGWAHRRPGAGQSREPLRVDRLI